MKYKSSGTYQPIMSNPTISTLISKRHVIWWVRPILQYSWPLPSDRSTCFLRLSRHSFLPIFFVLTFEGLATLVRPCGQASQMDPWHHDCNLGIQPSQIQVGTIRLGDRRRTVRRFTGIFVSFPWYSHVLPSLPDFQRHHTLFLTRHSKPCNGDPRNGSHR